MITRRIWTELKRGYAGVVIGKLYCEGWYLFGILPLYVIKREV